ncbi:MAG: acryloyl-CoA reductase [Acidimicrobiales bacterium]
MVPVPEQVRAFVAEQHDGGVTREVRTLAAGDLGEGDVLVAVSWSCVNYKDGLACTAGSKVARISPLVPGVDLAGTVVEPGASGLAPGTPVVVHGYDLGVAHHGGFAELARVPAAWVVPLPESLGEREAMAIGTAGFTAALSVHVLETRGDARPGRGPVLVTGATGGVGSTAVAMLAERGYEVVASTGKASAAGWLRSIGASEVIDRSETEPAGRPLEHERWAWAVDCVGGRTLQYVLATLRYGGSVAASGNTGGAELSTTVFPFILRSVSLLGVDSVRCPADLRVELWRRLGGDLRPSALGAIATEEIGLDGLPEALDRVLAGGNRGRTLVRPGA